MACNDASDASTLIAMQSHYHSVVGEVTNKRGEKEIGRTGERETWTCLREVLHRVLYPNTHTNGFLKKKKKS